MANLSPHNLKMLFGQTLVLAWLLLPSVSHGLPENKIKEYGFQKRGEIETVTIQLKHAAKLDYFILRHPERIVVDIDNTFISQVRAEQKTDGDIITRIRIGQNKKHITRVVADLSGEIPYGFDVVQTTTDDIPIVKILAYPPRFTDDSTIRPVILPIDIGPQNINASRTSQSPPPSAPTGGSGESETLLSLLDEEMPDDIFAETDVPEPNPDLSFSALLNLRTSVQVQEDDAVENNYSARNRIILEGQYKPFLTLSAISDYLYFGSEETKKDHDVEIHEAIWKVSGDKMGFSIGKQIKRWGKADQYSPIDTLNPEDAREFIIPEYEERKMPVWMADVNFFFDGFIFEGIFIPFFEPSRFHYFGTDWSVYGHMKKELAGMLPNALQTYVNNLEVNETIPDNESEFAARLIKTIGTVDLGLTFHRTIEDFPHFNSFPVKNINLDGGFSGSNLREMLNAAVFTNGKIEAEYKKTNIAGFEFETTMGDFGLRGEATWEENRSLLTSSLTSNRYPVMTYILGADHLTEKNTYFNVQLLYSHIFDHTTDILYFEQDSFALLGEFKIDLVSDWLQAALRYNISLNQNSAYLSPYLRYVYITNLECLLGAGLFSGDADTYFGRYQDNDLLYLNLYYHF